MESYKRHKRLEIASQVISSFAPELLFQLEDNPEGVDERIEEYVELSYKIANSLVNKYDENL